MVSTFGIEILPDHVKTPLVLQVLYSEQSKIKARTEIQHRVSQSPISADRIRELIIQATGSVEAADKAHAQYILESTRKQS